MAKPFRLYGEVPLSEARDWCKEILSEPRPKSIDRYDLNVRIYDYIKECWDRGDFNG